MRTKDSEKRIPINGAKLKADLKAAGTTARFASIALGKCETYLSEACRNNAMGEKSLEKLAELIQKDPEIYLSQPSEDLGDVYAGVDLQPIVSAINENAQEIKNLHNDIMTLTEVLADIRDLIDSKLVCYTSQINAKVKTIADSPIISE